MTSSQGKTLGNFVVVEELGRGGMGVVLLARQTSLERPAVLKKVRRDIADLPELAQRFEREARAAAAIHHQNVVAVYDYFRWRNDRYIAQEYVDGLDLSAVLERTGPLPTRIAAIIGLCVARGLEELHSRGTVHRDLKPANILVGRRGEVKIADFGLALEATGSSITQPGVMLGSLTYMPPEQMLGERVDARGDLFAAGIVLFELLAGRPPYLETAAPPEQANGKNEAERNSAVETKDEVDTESLLSRMQKERHPPLRRLAKGTPRRLARLIRSCMRGKARKRIASAAELRRRLEIYLGDSSPADSAAELASWLWERQVFDTRDNETVVKIGHRRATPTVRVPRWAALAVAATLTAALVGAWLLYPELSGLPSSLDIANLVPLRP